MIIIQNSVMGQGKLGAGHLPGKGMVVPVEFCLSLSGHAAVAHNDIGILRDKEVQLVGWSGALADVETAAGVVGHPRGVGASGLTLHRQGTHQLPLLSSCEAVAIINQSKQAAHQSSTPASTGSFT